MKDLLLKIVDDATATKWADALQETCDKFEINTPERQAGFIAQIAHESGMFKAVKENLNYSDKALLGVFPKYFNAENVQAYARQPEKIANRVYGNRMGNGDEASGDGFKYCGRGLIQLTGKNNYTSFGNAVGVDFVNNPELVETPQYAVMSAGWFWSSNGLNKWADEKNIEKMTKVINGGTIGLAHREELYKKLLG
jgi:putative chitinase